MSDRHHAQPPHPAQQYPQAPQYGEAPQYGQAPQYGHAPQYGQVPHYPHYPQEPHPTQQRQQGPPPRAPHPAGAQVQHTPGYAPPPEPRNGLGLAAVIIGPIGILFGFVPLTGFIAVVLALVAIPLALVGWSRIRKGRATNKGTTITGLVAGLLALVLGIWGISIVFTATNELVDSLERAAPVGPGAAAPAFEQQEAPLGTPPPVTTAGFGESISFEDGLVVEVSQPEAYSPGRYAIGHDAARAITFTVTIRNGTAAGVDIIGTTVNATHGGQQVSKIFSSGSSGGTENPQGTVLPGKSASFAVALSLPQDVADLQTEVMVGWQYDAAIFTGQV